MTWLHIPYQSVPDTLESSWDLERLSLELETSATLKTKSLKQKSWLKELKKDDLTMHLYGLTYEPLMRHRFVENWISSQEDSHANLTR